MSEKITASNLDEVIRMNAEIKDEIERYAQEILDSKNEMQVNSPAHLALQILKENGLIMMPIGNPYLGGAIYVKNDNKIPFINTAQPRANQYFTAWHEVYHLYFDKVSFDHMIETEAVLEERKAENFAAKMLLGNLMPLYMNLAEEMDFFSKICCCMDLFQAPYKAVLIALYEMAVENSNVELQQMIKENIDKEPTDIVEMFKNLGLDDTLVLPSNVINISPLECRMSEVLSKETEYNFHRDNYEHLKHIKREIVQILKS